MYIKLKTECIFRKLTGHNRFYNTISNFAHNKNGQVVHRKRNMINTVRAN